ncbi:MAG: lytic murein transglycosylase [Minisyncoccota bacterium]
MRKSIYSKRLWLMGILMLPVVFMAPVGHMKVLAGEEADDIQSDINTLEKKLKKEQAEYNILQQNLNQITSSLTSTQQLIIKVQTMLDQTEQTIGQKESEIANLEQQLILERHVLKGLLQEMYASSSLSLVDIVLKENDFMRVLQNHDNLLSTQEKMQNVIRDINEMHDKVTTEKISLEDVKADHAELLSIKNRQKQTLVSEKIETQDDLEDQATIVSRLQKQLNELQGDLNTLTGKSYNAKDIREAVEFASDKTGVPRGVLYGFLKQETNLGANTGQCTYDDVERVSVAGYKKYGKKYKASIDRLYRRRNLFNGIVDDLGYSKKKKVSCTIPFAKAGPNQGGAMGVAQFMSDTWLGWEARVKAQTGHSKPDPWDLTDGVMAMALKVKSAGGASNNASAIKRATIAYYGAYSDGYYKNVLYWSKNYKSLFK